MRNPGRKRKGGKSRAIGISGLGRFFLFFPDFLSLCSLLSDLMKALRIFWIIYGILRVCAGIAQVFFAPTATVMFGALLGRVPDPFTLMGFFHVVYVLAILVSFACGILGIFGGLAIGNSLAGRGMLIAASLLALSDLPIGIALGVYTLFHLFPAAAKENV